MDNALSNAVAEQSPVTHIDRTTHIPQVTAGSDTYKDFFRKLSLNFPKSAALITKQPYYQKFVPKSIANILPQAILDFRTNDTLDLDDRELFAACKKLEITVTAAQARAVEVESREQSKSGI